MTDAPEEQPRLEISEPAGMRAMAHPARLAALQHLMMVGPATATELGGMVGLSASAMSYHLRNLERAGMVQTAPSRGDGRERVWRSTYEGYSVETFEDGTLEMHEASRELIESILMAQEMRIRHWLSQADSVPGWLDTGYFTETIIVITAEEMKAVGRQIDALLKPYTAKRRRDAPDGASKLNVVLRAIPAAFGLPELGLPDGDVKE